MTKIFSIDELSAIIKPYDILDVLESLQDNGLIEGYEIDYLLGEVLIDIPQGIEIKDIMDSFGDIETSRKVTKQ